MAILGSMALVLLCIIETVVLLCIIAFVVFICRVYKTYEKAIWVDKP